MNNIKKTLYASHILCKHCKLTPNIPDITVRQYNPLNTSVYFMYYQAEN
jgi:hypothetical protein